MKVVNIHEHKGKFFSILDQTYKSQVGVMTLAPGSDSGPEDIHDGDQIVYVVEGQMILVVEQKEFVLEQGDLFIIATKANHHIYNKSDKELFFLTIYAPPAY